MNGVMAHIMMEFGKMEKETGQECFSNEKELNIKVNGKMISSMGKVFQNLKMVTLLLANGIMIGSME